MEKAGYDCNNPVALRKVVEVETHGLNKIQKKIQEQGGLVEVPKVGLGYTPVQPIRISGRPKAMQNVVQHISAEEIGKSEDENAQPPIKPFVFDRLQPSALRKHSFVFTRIKGGQNPKSSVFWRVKNCAQPKPSVFNRISKARESLTHYPKNKRIRCSIDLVIKTKYKVLSLLA